MTLLVIYFILAITLSFLCSLLEAVLLSVPHAHVALMNEKKRRSGEILARYKEKIDRPLSAILTINTVANTVGAAGVGAQALAVYGSKWVALASGILTLTILVFSEIIPKTLGSVYAKELAPVAAYLIKGLIFLTYPLVAAFEFISGWISGRATLIRVTREEFLVAADMGREEGQLQDREQSVINNLLRLHNIYVRDVLTPRSVMFALPREQTVGETFKEYDAIYFSRIPVFGRDLDDINLMVHRWEISRAFSQGQTEKKLEDLAHQITVVPGSKSVAAVLDEFIQRREHLFLVVDEYGGTAGIITLEDAIETLLGVEIVDERDPVEDMQAFALEQWEKRKKSRKL